MIAGFLERIGIPLRAERLEGEQFLAGIEIRDGGLIYDRDKLFYPGDLLHEAGHVAVTEPSLRTSLSEPSNQPFEEVAAIAWSWAAATEIGLAPEIVFHEGGYRGASAAFIDNFSNGGGVGVSWLAAWGMTIEGYRAGDSDGPVYPEMQRWLR